MSGVATTGLEDPAWWRARQDDYLAAATSVFLPGSPLNLIDHLERARREASHVVDWDRVTPDVVARWCFRIDGWLDCADFDILRLLTLWLGYGDALPDHVRDALRQRFLGFRYWYTDPVELEVPDERWYWSENHRLIFHTCEYLAGQTFPDERFGVTGLTGAEHRDRARVQLDAWYEDKAVYGFSEWHSDVYYAKDLAPLVTLTEFADDPAEAERAATFLDLVLYDLALHTHRGNMGVTHGRSYMKDKSQAPDQPVFGAVKLCFATTDVAWPVDEDDDVDLLPRNESATVLARAARYRPPTVLRAVAASRATWQDDECMGLPIDPSEPLTDAPTRDDGLSYDDPAMVPFWWDRGALTPWQLIPLTMDTLDRHDLWRANLFALFDTVRSFTGGDVAVTRQLAADLHPMVNAGLLEEVHTTTWRSAAGMLSSAQAYRPGTASFQHHAWQATLDEYAVVFTTQPGNGPTANAGDYLDHDRYWTGSATLPRVTQVGPTAVVAYQPGFVVPDLDVLEAFAYLPETHAFFPTERFDKVVTRGHWTCARQGDGLVGLWSWRPVTWRDHDPAEVFTNGLTRGFDLVAEGGADNVWVVQMGDVAEWGDLAAWADALVAAELSVVDPAWDATGPHPGFAVRWDAPGVGLIEVPPGTGAEVLVDGSTVDLHRDQRFANPFSQVERGATTVPIRVPSGTVGTGDAPSDWVLDLAAGTRRPD